MKELPLFKRIREVVAEWWWMGGSVLGRRPGQLPPLHDSECVRHQNSPTQCAVRTCTRARTRACVCVTILVNESYQFPSPNLSVPLASALRCRDL